MCGILLYFSNNHQKTIAELLDQNNLIQHRGQDCLGFLYSNNLNLEYCSVNSVKGIISNYKNDLIKYSKCNLFLSHLRYKTSGPKSNIRVQPVVSKNKFGDFAFVFNGNIPKMSYESEYQDITVDTDLVLNFILQKATTTSSWDELLKEFVLRFKRSFSMILVTNENIYIVKDRYAVRPLCYAITNNTLEICSETCGISLTNTEINELDSGTVLKIIVNEDNTLKSELVFKLDYQNAICLFEMIYFMSPKSKWYENSITDLRNSWGIELAKKDIDFLNQDYIAIGIPSSGIIPGKSYASHLKLPYKQAIVKNKKINRTFILSEQERDKISKQKYIYDEKVISGKRVIIIDDSIVRGITMNNIVSKLFGLGAKEVHIRICAPEVKDVCYFGININSKDELVSSTKNVEEVNNMFKSTSLRFLNIDLMLSHISNSINNKMCSGCFNSDYRQECNKFIDW